LPAQSIEKKFFLNGKTIGMNEIEEYRPLSIQRWLSLFEPLTIYFLRYQVVVERHNFSFRIQGKAYDLSRIFALSPVNAYAINRLL